MRFPRMPTATGKTIINPKVDPYLSHSSTVRGATGNEAVT